MLRAGYLRGYLLSRPTHPAWAGALRFDQADTMKRDDTQFYLNLVTFIGMVGIYVLLYKTYQTYQAYAPQIQAAEDKLATGSTLLTNVGSLFGIKQTSATS